MRVQKKCSLCLNHTATEVQALSDLEKCSYHDFKVTVRYLLNYVGSSCKKKIVKNIFKSWI